MTSTPARGAESVRGAPVRSPRASFVTPALIILLVAGLALRFAIAFVFFPQSGFSSDLSSYAAWANTLAQYGPGGFYANAGFADYPPGYLLLLWPIGLIAQSGGLGLASEDLIKIPPILIDVAVALVLYLLVKALGAPAWPALGRASGTRGRRDLPLQPGHLVRLGAVGPDGRGRCAGHPDWRRGADPRQRRRRDRARGDRRDGQAPVRCRPHPAGRRRPPEAAPVQSGLGPDPPPARRRPHRRVARLEPGPRPHRDRVPRRMARLLRHGASLRDGPVRVPDVRLEDGRRLPVPDRERVQPVGAHRRRRAAARWPPTASGHRTRSRCSARSRVC